ncbi:glycerophosphodiester phosphodiesterase family protein [Devosia beringensis]|uniref:glycerophosphodiester phosphodiesterase family protein n=1 Tax=Devosia beringensis TaxID=2657486 RepID=UPI00186B7D0A|nr:glycerophosphodiester phosphodiesterase family protein [Devosia beringensis]
MRYKDFLADTTRPCSVVAHRGDWRDAPENSLLAIERAIALGCTVVEIDVRRTADGDFVLLHDDDLMRTASVAAMPEDINSADLTRLPLRNRDGGIDNDFNGQLLPRLTDVFALTRDRIFVHLDIKHRAVIGEVIALAQAMGVDQQVDVWADVATEADAHWVEQTVLSPGIAFVARTRLEQASGPRQLELMFGLKPDICELSFSRLDQVTALQQRFAAAQIPLWVNTLNGVASPGFTDAAALQDPAAIWGALLTAGVSSIQTDEMAALQRFLQTLR